MVRVSFTPTLQRHLTCTDLFVRPGLLSEVLDRAFSSNPRLRGYILDEQSRLRKHVVVFIDGSPAQDCVNLSDVVTANSEVFVMQALSGG